MLVFCEDHLDVDVDHLLLIALIWSGLQNLNLNPKNHHQLLLALIIKGSHNAAKLPHLSQNGKQHVQDGIPGFPGGTLVRP